jgi:hypothetical protein
MDYAQEFGHVPCAATPTLKWSFGVKILSKYEQHGQLNLLFFIARLANYPIPFLQSNYGDIALMGLIPGQICLSSPLLSSPADSELLTLTDQPPTSLREPRPQYEDELVADGTGRHFP